jgi:NitT/TauT family transport system ATP-binding protein
MRATATDRTSGAGQADTAVQAASASLEVVQVSKSFRRQGQVTPALEGIDLAVTPGEFVALLGPSGCGKSTLLHIIAGFIAPDSGSVRMDGSPVGRPHADRCMLFQSPTLFPWLTVRQNVLFGPRARGLSMNEARQRADDLIRLVGLDGFGQHFPHQLSGGMRHRAALARALINRPRVLLMDEPFAALDAITREAMQAFLLELWQRERTTILFVTHDVEEATLLADRVCVMSARPGRIAAVKPVGLPRPRSKSIRDEPDFVALRRALRGELERLIA